MTSSDPREKDAGLPSGGPCSACRKSAAVNDSLCGACTVQLAVARHDAAQGGSGCPGQCSVCGRIGSLRAKDGWCDSCHQRWRKSGWPGDRPAPVSPPEKKPSLPDYARTGARLDKMTRLRVMWALARTGEENPYECIAPGCHETANPGRQYHCAMHEQRLQRAGTYRPHQCARCGDDFKRYGGDRMLCDLCRESWGYCGSTIHEGGRILPLERMCSGRASGGCKECSNLRNRERRHAEGMPSRAEWIARSRRAVVAGVAADVVMGTLVTYQTLADALGLDAGRQREQIQAAANAAQATLRNHGRKLVAVSGRGYRVELRQL